MKRKGIKNVELGRVETTVSPFLNVEVNDGFDIENIDVLDYEALPSVVSTFSFAELERLRKEGKKSYRLVLDDGRSINRRLIAGNKNVALDGFLSDGTFASYEEFEKGYIEYATKAFDEDPKTSTNRAYNHAKKASSWFKGLRVGIEGGKYRYLNATIVVE